MTLLIPLAVIPVKAEAAETSVNVESYTLHNMSDNSGYKPSSSNKVSTLNSGHTKLGTLTVKGDVKKKSYNGYEAYAVYGSSITFEYTQTWSDKTYGGHNWVLSTDTNTSISGVSTGEIGNGGFVVLKSTDNGSTWTATGAKSVSINGKKVTFTPGGSEIKNGCLYKFISVCEGKYKYKSGTKKEWTSPFTYKTVNVYSYHYENFAQVSTIYVASDTCSVAFYSKATDNYNVSKDFGDVDEETLKIISKGTTLTDGSISFNYIKVDKLGNGSFDVTYSYNGGSYKTASDGQKFTSPGYYKFKITSKFGTQRKVNLWILDLGNDMAYSKYFGTSFVGQDMRVYDATSSLPVYMVGTKLSLSPKSYVPGISGKIYRYADADAVAKNSYETVHTYSNITSSSTVILSKTGIYCADLYVGNTNVSGEIIHYQFYFSVVNDPDYMPTVNLELLKSADRNVMLERSAYGVNFATAGGGSYVFLFPATDDGYLEALAFAEEIEYRFIEEYTDADGSKYYYYRTNSSSGLKTRYDSKLAMFEVLNENVANNVNRIYVNSSEKYATVTLDEAIRNVENTSIRNDVFVCVNDQIRNELVTDDIIINGYQFFQAADFESQIVVVTDESGYERVIPYGVPVENVLSSTGRYLIKERNWNATNSYYVNFLAPDDVTGTINYTYTKDFVCNDGVISRDSAGSVIEANTVTLTGGGDRYDSQAIAVITANDTRKTMLLSEIDGYTITESGRYTVEVINRCGYKYTLYFNITEAPKTDVIFEGNESYNYAVHYGEKLGKLPEISVYGYDFIGWAIDGDLVDEDTVCMTTGELTLSPVLVAKKVSVMLYDFSGLTTVTADYGSVISLSPGADVGTYFKFAYWNLGDTPLKSLRIDSTEPIVLVATYYLAQNGGSAESGDVYSISQVSSLMPHSGAISDVPANSRPGYAGKDGDTAPVADADAYITEGKNESGSFWTVAILVCLGIITFSVFIPSKRKD